MKRILVTRPRAQADSLVDGLRAAGFEPICFPVIEISALDDNVALDRAISKLDCYDWVVFTSVNAVEVVFDVIARSTLTTLSVNSATKQSSAEARRLLRFARSDIAPRVAAIGPKTAEALQARGISPDFIPDEFMAESILPGLGDLRGKWVLLPRAEIARKALPEAIVNAGGVAHEITVYQTLPARPDSEDLSSLKMGVDWITFTSPSTVHNFVEIVRKHKLDPFQLTGNPRIACIGPITERAAQDQGFEVALVAKEYTTEGLVEEIWRQENK